MIGTNSNCQLSDESEISLVTCRPGNEIFACWGHTAIWVHDSISNIDDLYNWGMYSFAEPNFYLKFLKGKLPYHMGKQNPNRFLTSYAYENRSVFVQKLNLNTDQKNKLYSSIRENYQPENRKYLYDFFFDNCSTRPRDLFQDAILGLQFPGETARKISYRNMINQYTLNHAWADFGIDLIIGSLADKEALTYDQMFLPEYLMSIIDKSSNGHEPLVKDTITVLDFESKIEQRNHRPWLSPSLFFGLLLLLEFYLFSTALRNGATIKGARIYDKSWFLLLAVSSLILLFMWFGTDHKVTKANYNVLWANPIFFVHNFLPKKLSSIIPLLFLALSLIAACFFQEFHPATLIIITITIFKLLRSFILDTRQQA